mgnify:CR=1 FL=1
MRAGRLDTPERRELADNVSPHLAWSDLPAGTRSLALICHDFDVPEPRRRRQPDRPRSPGRPAAGRLLPLVAGRPAGQRELPLPAGAFSQAYRPAASASRSPASSWTRGPSGTYPLRRSSSRESIRPGFGAPTISRRSSVNTMQQPRRHVEGGGARPPRSRSSPGVKYTRLSIRRPVGRSDRSNTASSRFSDQAVAKRTSPGT